MVLNNTDKHGFEDVAHVYAHRENGKISEIIVQKRGASLVQVVEEVKQLHQQWKGEDLGDLSSWERDVEGGNLQPHNTIIRDDRKNAEPAIWVNIHPDFNPPDEAWYVAIVYSWPRDASGKATERKDK